MRPIWVADTIFKLFVSKTTVSEPGIPISEWSIYLKIGSESVSVGLGHSRVIAVSLELIKSIVGWTGICAVLPRPILVRFGL